MTFLKTFRHSLVAAAIGLVAVVGLAKAADMVFSTGTQFLTGPRMIDGSDLNIMVDRVNDMSAGSFSADLLPSVDGTYDLGSTTLEWQDLWIDGTANIDTLAADAGTATALTITTADINGGTVDGTIIGGSSAAAITGTTIGGTTITASTQFDYPAATSCSGTTTATCEGQRNIVSVTGLTTAAGANSAAMTVTNALVSGTSMIMCTPGATASAGGPIPTDVTAGTGSYSFVITNAGGASLDATVTANCLITN